MLDFLKYANWSNLQEPENDPITYLTVKKNILFSRFCILGVSGAVIQGIYDFTDGYPMVMLFDLFIAGFLFGGYSLNERGHHKTSKVLVFALSNITLFVLASVVPKGVGVYLLFYPLVVFSIIAFEYQERIYTYFFSATSLILGLVLVATNFQPFGHINLQPTDPTISFVLNLIISFVLISVGIDFLKNLSNKAETQLVELHKKTALLAKELAAKNKDLEKTNNELDQFVYSASHDLRAPLSSIAGILNLIKLEKAAIPQIIAHYHHLIEDRVTGLDSFIKDILEYSRNARTEIKQSQVQVDKLVQEALEQNSYLPQASLIRFTTEIKVNTPLILDKTRTFSVLNNLISNAIKYNDTSKPKPFVSISARLNNNILTFVVQDSGEGICESCKSHVFEMFYRGTESSGGSGLGLYITKEMVEKMGGSIHFETKENEGTTFTFSIPVTKNKSAS